MAKFLLFFLLLHSVLVVFCLEQADLDYVGSNLRVKFEVIDNLFEVEKFKARIHLTNNGNDPIVKGPWAIYLYNLFMIEPDHLPHEGEYAVPNTNLLVSHENGNLFKMRPGDHFADFGPGATLMIDLVIQFWTVSKSDVMPNWYVAAEGLELRLIKSTADGNEDFIGDFSSTKQYKRYDFDEYNPFTPKERFDRYNYNSAVTEKVLIPTPLECKMSDNSETTTVNNQWKVKCQNFDDECSYLREQLGLEAADCGTVVNIIEVTSGSMDILEGYSKEESYSLIVRKEVRLSSS